MPRRNDQLQAGSRDDGDQAQRRSPIVGIGASAGGLEALEKLFGAMPADSGMAFVVIQHLDPTKQSHMVELLGRRTGMHVVEVREGARVEPNCVYMILPNSEVTIRECVLHLAEPSERRAARRPVDTFLASLAEDQKDCAVGVILSGTGSNGSSGIRAIKEFGGLAIAQAPETASQPGMPRSAIATGMVDLVLPPEQMPDVLVRYARHLDFARIPEDAGPEDEEGPAFSRILAFLQARTGHDLRFYKKGTLMRRMHRRLGLLGLERFAEYERFLRGDADELKALSKDLMISVTGFFRDPEAWEVLDEKVITALVAERESGDAIRVWVPACASGEEAYTTAMLIAERADAAQKSFDVKIFATDSAEESLSMARRGRFPATIERDVSDERLRRFFEPADDTCQVRKELRDWVVVAPQNLLQDPPFFRVDLVSCRNFLIYLEEEAQRKVIALFHFALSEGGHLFLGPAETLGRHSDLFNTVSKKWRIYRRIGPTRHDIIDFPIAAQRAHRRGAGIQAAAEQPSLSQTAEIAQRALATRFGPAAVMVDRGHRIVYFHGPTEEFLVHPPGHPTRDLFAMAPESLRTKLRGAVQRAVREERPVAISASMKPGRIIVTVSPLRGPRSEGMLLVTFEQDKRSGPDTPTASAASEPEARSMRDIEGDREFETELKDVQEELRRTIEELETSNEELKGSNEEVTSINEELQTANEELETSKEELQSLNEELNTVNVQLQRKVEELEETTNDLSNLFTSTDVATLFLDHQLRIRFVTPAVGKLMDITRADSGRPLGSFAMKFSDPSLLPDAETVLEKLVPSEADVPADDDRWYLRRIVPYRTKDDRIDGVVVTFSDITTPKHAEQSVRAAHDQIAQIYDSVPHPLVVLDPQLRVRSANEAFYDVFRAERGETEGRAIYELGNRQWDVHQLREDLAAVISNEQPFHDFAIEHEFEHLGRRIMLLHARRVNAADLVLLSIQDITERRHWEEHQMLLVSELSHRVKNILATVQSIAAQTGRTSRSIEGFLGTFFGRIQALGDAHALLTQRDWEGAAMRDVVEEPLRAHETARDRIRLSGENLGLKPQAAVTLSLVIYELGTNAVKYGALSTPSGRVDVAWELLTPDLGPQVRLIWSEEGGPAAEPPSTRGFGLTLIERSIAHELDGRVTFDFRKGGLRCEIVIPRDPRSFLDLPGTRTQP